MTKTFIDLLQNRQILKEKVSVLMLLFMSVHFTQICAFLHSCSFLCVTIYGLSKAKVQIISNQRGFRIFLFIISVKIRQNRSEKKIAPYCSFATHTVSPKIHTFAPESFGMRREQIGINSCFCPFVARLMFVRCPFQ